MTNLSPYRALGTLDKTVPKNTFGLIRASKKPKPHICKPPYYLIRCLYWLIGKPIDRHSLYRCKCGDVWVLSNPFGDGWDRTRTLDWVARGGDAED